MTESRTNNVAENLISTHTSRVGCDCLMGLLQICHQNFYSHIPCGMWPVDTLEVKVASDFYSHIPCGMWLAENTVDTLEVNFYSHIPCGMWQRGICPSFCICKFLLTHPVWDVTWHEVIVNNSCKFLLTHPVWDVTKTLAESDNLNLISTHTSRVGCDYSEMLQWFAFWGFLLTHPVWDVTVCNRFIRNN